MGGLFAFARGAATDVCVVLALAAGAIEAWAGFPRLNGLPFVAVPRLTAGVAIGGAFFGNCGRTTATALPLFSNRSGFTLWSTGNAPPSLIFMVGIFVRDALAMVFGSIPLFTIELLRTWIRFTFTAE